MDGDHARLVLISGCVFALILLPALGAGWLVAPLYLAVIYRLLRGRPDRRC